MPLNPTAHVCGFGPCERETYYYKEIFVPFSEGIFVSNSRPRRKGRKGFLYLCHEHYQCEPGNYELTMFKSVEEDYAL